MTESAPELRRNEAGRLLRVLHRAGATAGSIQQVEMWTQVLEVPTDLPPHRRITEIVRRLGLLHGQLDRVERRIDETPFPPAYYGPVFEQIRRGLSCDNLQNQAAIVQQHIGPATMAVLAAVAYSVPEAEPPVPEVELTELRAGIESLLADVREAELPREVRIFIEEQLAELLRAIRDYPLVGVEAFVRAAGAVVIDWSIRRPAEESVTTRPLLARLRGIVEQTARVADAVIKGEKLLAAGSRLLEFGEHIAKHT